MKNLISALFALLWLAAPAFALTDAASPTKVPTTWAQSAPGGNSTCPMPIPSQISITPGRASWTDGFPPLNFLPIAGGGIPPSGQDFNGVLCQLSQWTRWYNAGAPIFYDPTFQSAIGGYPSNSLIQSATNPGHFWLSTVDNNASNPDTGGANWKDLYLTTIGSTFAGTATQPTANDIRVSIIGWNTNLSGVPIQFSVLTANTGSATFWVNGLGSPIALLKRTVNGLVAMTGGELQPGQIYSATFDGTFFEANTIATTRFNIVTISATGTYTPSSGTISADVSCIGGGGAGGGSVTTSSTAYAAGSGGGGGEIREGTFTASQLFPTVSVTIGSGGTGVSGGNGNSGATTSFLSINAAGGQGGIAPAAVVSPSLTSQIGGNGGSGGSGGSVATPGANGGTAWIFNLTSAPQTQATSGAGGAGLNGGGGGLSLAFGQTTAGSNGNPGLGFGAGGSGASAGASNANHSGGNGSGGACVVKELIVQ